MSHHFAGTSWASSHFAGSHFRAAVAAHQAGHHWANSQFKTKHFATTHFRGIAVAGGAEGHHWKNSQFKCSQFETRHFRGVRRPAPTVAPFLGSGGTGRVVGIKRIEIPTKRRPLDRSTALALILDDSEQLL